MRVVVPLAQSGDGGDRRDDGEAAVYCGDPGPLGVPDEWPGEGPLAERVRAYVDTTDVVVRRADDRQD